MAPLLRSRPAPKGMRLVHAETAHHCASCVHEHLRSPDHKQAMGSVGIRCDHSTPGPRVNWESRGPDFPSPVRILASEPTADYSHGPSQSLDHRETVLIGERSRVSVSSLSGLLSVSTSERGVRDIPFLKGLFKRKS